MTLNEQEAYLFTIFFLKLLPQIIKAFDNAVHVRWIFSIGLVYSRKLSSTILQYVTTYIITKTTGERLKFKPCVIMYI